MQGGTLSMGNNYLDVKTGGVMNVSGNLVVDSMLFDNNSVVDITSTGNVTVYGGFKNKNNSNSIVIDGSMTVYGNAFFGWGSTITGNGTVTVDGSSSGTGYVYCNLPGCMACTFTNNCLLPVKLVAFTASFNYNAVDLQWATATESNNKCFTVERSTNGTDFRTVATINGAGSTSIKHSYAYNDMLPENGVDYYRLKQTDYDGNSAYSQVIATDVSLPANALTIIPNPARNNCLVTFYDNTNETFQLSVYDYTGREVLARIVESVRGANSITLDVSSLTAGLYFIALPVNGMSLNARIVKQ